MGVFRRFKMEISKPQRACGRKLDQTPHCMNALSSQPKLVLTTIWSKWVLLEIHIFLTLEVLSSLLVWHSVVGPFVIHKVPLHLQLLFYAPLSEDDNGGESDREENQVDDDETEEDRKQMAHSNGEGVLNAYFAPIFMRRNGSFRVARFYRNNTQKQQAAEVDRQLMQKVCPFGCAFLSLMLSVV